MQQESNLEWLRFTVTPTQCYHLYIEDYFQWTKCNKTTCGNCDSFCLGEVRDFTGRILKKHLISAIATKVLGKNMSCLNFMKALKGVKEKIWHPKDIPKKFMGPVHGLALQLVAKGIFAMSVANPKNIGKPKFCTDNIVIIVPNRLDNSVLMLLYMI